MPGFDGTGPYWALTGRGLGPCGRGFRRGFGWRVGWDCRAVVLTKEEQKKILEAELKEIEGEKQEIEKKLRELK